MPTYLKPTAMVILCFFFFLVFLQSINNQYFLLPLNSYVVISPTLKNFSLRTRRNLIFGILEPKIEQSMYYFLQYLLTVFKEQRHSADLKSPLGDMEDRPLYIEVMNHTTNEHTHG